MPLPVADLSTTTVSLGGPALDLAVKLLVVLLSLLVTTMIVRARGFIVGTLLRNEFEPNVDRMVIASLRRQKPEVRALTFEVWEAEVHANAETREHVRALVPDVASVKQMAEAQEAILSDVTRALDANTMATQSLTRMAEAAELRERETTKVLERILGALSAQGFKFTPS
jgi:hypothetical protein